MVVVGVGGGGIQIWRGESLLKRGEGEFFQGAGDEKILGWWWGLPPSPLTMIGKTLYVATANCIINVLFDDHKILIMYQSNYYQNELKTLDVKLTFDVK